MGLNHGIVLFVDASSRDADDQEEATDTWHRSEIDCSSRLQTPQAQSMFTCYGTKLTTSKQQARFWVVSLHVAST